MFDVCTRVTRYTSIRYSSACHTRVNMGASIFFTAAMIRDVRSARSRGNCGTYYYIPRLPRDLAGADHCRSEEYRCTYVEACMAELEYCIDVPCYPCCTHRTPLVIKKRFSIFLWQWKIPSSWVLRFSCYKYL
jgi:hypothetical protein